MNRCTAALDVGVGAKCGPHSTPMYLEIRTYSLKPGTRAEFLRLMFEVSLPLLASFGIIVVDSGVSLVDEPGQEAAYLIRAFSSLEQHQQQEEAFYGSADWRDGPREEILTMIESYHSVVINASSEAVAALTLGQ